MSSVQTEAVAFDPSAATARLRGGRIRLTVFMVLVAAALCIGAGLVYRAQRHYESTEDAYIDGHIAQVAAQIGGRVIGIAVADNQPVAAGQLLVSIDPADARVGLLRAQAQQANAAAQLHRSEAQLTLGQTAIDQAAAQTEVAEAQAVQARQDLARLRGVDQAAITRQQLDGAVATLRVATARLAAQRQAVQGARAQRAADQAGRDAAAAMLLAAQADVADARLHLSYTAVTAPFAGRVTRRAVEPGNYIAPGQTLLSVVAETMWVTANFKETQIGAMRPGQKARIRIDQYPGRVFDGHVDSFQTGTGAAFSAIPVENATGNYVKVVQRLPVKIVFDAPPADRSGTLRLAPGLSVTPQVTVR